MAGNISVSLYEYRNGILKTLLLSSCHHLEGPNTLKSSDAETLVLPDRTQTLVHQGLTLILIAGGKAGPSPHFRQLRITVSSSKGIFRAWIPG